MELIYVIIALLVLEVILLISKVVTLIRKKRLKGRPRNTRYY